MGTSGPMRINLCLINVAHLTTQYMDVRVVWQLVEMNKGGLLPRDLSLNKRQSRIRIGKRPSDECLLSLFLKTFM